MEGAWGWNGASGVTRGCAEVKQHGWVARGLGDRRDWGGSPESAQKWNDSVGVARGSGRQRVQEGVRRGGMMPVGGARG